MEHESGPLFPGYARALAREPVDECDAKSVFDDQKFVLDAHDGELWELMFVLQEEMRTCLHVTRECDREIGRIREQLDRRPSRGNSALYSELYALQRLADDSEAQRGRLVSHLAFLRQKLVTIQSEIELVRLLSKAIDVQG